MTLDESASRPARDTTFHPAGRPERRVVSEPSAAVPRGPKVGPAPRSRWGGILGAIAMLAAVRTIGRWAGTTSRRRGGAGATGWLWGGGLAAAGLAGTTVGVLVDRRSRRREPRALLVERSVTIGRPAEELHRLLRAPGILPLLTGRLADVGLQEDIRWILRAGLPRGLDWDECVVEERSGQLVHWESPSESRPRGSVFLRLQPAPRDLGTEVSIHLRLELDGHLLGRSLRPVLTALTSNALHRFKSLAETGEVPALTGQPAARNHGRDAIGGQS